MVFQFCFRKLQALNTNIADSLRQHLEERYKQRRNGATISMIKFLSDPKGYLPGDGFLELSKLSRKHARGCSRTKTRQHRHSLSRAKKTTLWLITAKSLIFKIMQ